MFTNRIEGTTIPAEAVVHWIKNGRWVFPTIRKECDKHKAQSIVMSFISGFPMDPIFLVPSSPDYDHYIIADGAQRCSALVDFCDGKFTLQERPNDSSVARYKEELYGKSYADVAERFDNFPIMVYKFKVEKQEDVADALELILDERSNQADIHEMSSNKLNALMSTNEVYATFWKKIDHILIKTSEPSYTDIDEDAKIVAMYWINQFFLFCFNHLSLSKEELERFAENILASGNECMKYTLWKDLFALHGHTLSADDVRKVCNDKSVITLNDIFNALLEKTHDEIWAPL